MGEIIKSEYLQKTFVATKADGGMGERIVFKSFHERVDENGTPISPPLPTLTLASPFFRTPFILYG